MTLAQILMERPPAGTEGTRISRRWEMSLRLRYRCSCAHSGSAQATQLLVLDALDISTCFESRI